MQRLEIRSARSPISVDDLPSDGSFVVQHIAVASAITCELLQEDKVE